MSAGAAPTPQSAIRSQELADQREEIERQREEIRMLREELQVRAVAPPPPPSPPPPPPPPPPTTSSHLPAQPPAKASASSKLTKAGRQGAAGPGANARSPRPSPSPSPMPAPMAGDASTRPAAATKELCQDSLPGLSSCRAFSAIEVEELRKGAAWAGRGAAAEDGSAEDGSAEDGAEAPEGRPDSPPMTQPPSPAAEGGEEQPAGGWGMGDGGHGVTELTDGEEDQEDEEEAVGEEEEEPRSRDPTPQAEPTPSRWAAAAAARKLGPIDLSQGSDEEEAERRGEDGRGAPSATQPKSTTAQKRAASSKQAKSPRRAGPSAARSPLSSGSPSGANVAASTAARPTRGKRTARGGKTGVESPSLTEYEADPSDDFTPKSSARMAARQQQQHAPKPAANAPRLAFSSLCAADVDTLQSVGAALGAHVLSEVQAESATHLIVGLSGSKRAPGAPKRTLKVLHAILRGAWLVSDAWLLESLEAGELLDEAAYEVSCFPGAKRARERREAGSPIAPLAGLAVAIVDKDTESAARLRSMATSAGATLTSATRAEVCIDGVKGGAGATSSRRRASVTVAAEWLYDSISHLERMPHEAFSA